MHVCQDEVNAVLLTVPLVGFLLAWGRSVVRHAWRAAGPRLVEVSVEFLYSRLGRCLLCLWRRRVREGRLCRKCEERRKP